MSRLKTLLLHSLLLLLTPTLVTAAERYISGIPIPLRAEPDPANRQILQLLPVGSKVVTDNKQKNSFSKITTDSGIHGWIPTRYLTENAPTTSAGSGTEQKQVKYELEINRLKGTISSIQQERQIIEAEVQKLKEHIRRANLEVTTIRGVSSNALELEKENTRLRGERRTEQRKLEVLQQENVALQDRKERNWFLMGALVVLFSLLSGFFLSRLRGGGKRNHSRI